MCNLHGPVRAPESVGTGTAQVTIAFDTWKEGRVAPTTHEIAVVAPKTVLKLEPVSARLKRELIHPNKTGSLTGLRYSPDGKRLVASDYPGGVVVVWDVATGERLSTIETSHGYEGSYAFSVSPDWRTLFVALGKRSAEQVEQDGKRMFRWQTEGEVRAWDLASGQLQRVYKHPQGRDIFGMLLFPDGTKFITQEMISGISDGSAKQSVSLWDVRTGEHRPLPERLQTPGKFSPDGRSLALMAADPDGKAAAIKLLDTATGQERLTIPAADPNAWTMIFVTDFTPDGRLMVGGYQVVTREKNTSSLLGYLKWWDVATGRELASFTGETDESFPFSRFSPDGRLLANVNYRTARTDNSPKQVRLFRTSDQQLIKTIALGQPPPGERLVVREPLFSPDSRWLVVITQQVVDKPGAVDALDVPQARIHLIDVATGTIRETLIAPQGLVMSPCFSPDGKTLATGGHGRVLLWDLTKPIGER